MTDSRLVPLLAAFLLIPSGPARAGDPAKTASGEAIDLDAPAGGVTVVVFLSTECPISNAYSPTINQIARNAPAGRVNLIGVCVDPDLTDAETRGPRGGFRARIPGRPRSRPSHCEATEGEGDAGGLRDRRRGKGAAIAAGSTTSTRRGRSETPTRGPPSCATRSTPCSTAARSPGRTSRPSGAPCRRSDAERQFISGTSGPASSRW